MEERRVSISLSIRERECELYLEAFCYVSFIFDFILSKTIGE